MERICRTKIDWFVDDILKQTFNSYEHTVEFFRKELNNERINYNAIKNVINKKKSTIIENNIPDIRLHVYKVDENTPNIVCSFCDKPFTQQFFYTRSPSKCKECYFKPTGDKHIKTFMNILNDNWKSHPEFDYIYFVFKCALL